MQYQKDMIHNINNKQDILRRFNEELNENSISLQKRLESVLKRTGIALNDIWGIKDNKERQRIIKKGDNHNSYPQLKNNNIIIDV